MQIEIDIYTRKKEDGTLCQIFNETLTESDIVQMIKDRWNSEDIPIPMHLNREDFNIDVSIGSVTID